MGYSTRDNAEHGVKACRNKAGTRAWNGGRAHAKWGAL